MTLVLIVPSFPKLSETFIVSKFLGLLTLGWDVYIVCSESDLAQWKNFPDLVAHPDARDRIKVCWPHRPRWWAALLMPFAFIQCLCLNLKGTWRYASAGMRRFGFGVLRRFYLDATLLALKPDLVHYEFGALAVEKMYLKQLLGCKVITSFRGYDLNFTGLEHSHYYDDIWQGSDALHLLGADLWRRAQNRGCPAEIVHSLIPPAINSELFNPGTRMVSENNCSATRKVCILSVGRLEWKKGYEYAIQAIRMLRDSGVHCEYHVIGNGSYMEPLAFARHQLGLDNEVVFTGAMTPSQVRDRMLAADIFLHAAVSEGFCNAVLEAQAMKLPVVCSDADGLPENVVDGETGFVVPRRSAMALAEKLRQLALSPSLRRRMGEAGNQRVLKWFQPFDQIAAFDLLYHSVWFRD
jgi:colanic acid/amylovoran biosynthesis glycosyltransferase